MGIMLEDSAFDNLEINLREKYTHTLIPKNDATEPKARLL